MGEEIKQLLNRIRELDEQYGVPSSTDDRQGETTSGSAVPDEIPAKRAGRARKPYQHHDYPTIDHSFLVNRDEFVKALKRVFDFLRFYFKHKHVD